MRWIVRETQPPQAGPMHDSFLQMFFEASYRFGFAEWAIGRPQPDLVRAVESGALAACPRVCDVGCGTGDTAIFLAERGHEVVAVDRVRRAITLARARAEALQLAGNATFMAADVFSLPELEIGRFDAIVDSGLLHQFTAPQAKAYVALLRGMLRPSGVALVHAFRDHGPARSAGPRRLSESDLLDAFGEGWRCQAIEPAQFHATSARTYPAWLARFERVGVPGRPDGETR
jgi:cyclopropane fatty-acyl-phospholipid synthase-like methyltransferase